MRSELIFGETVELQEVKVCEELVGTGELQEQHQTVTEGSDIINNNTKQICNTPGSMNIANSYS